MMHYYGWNNWGMPFDGFGMILMIFFWIFVVWGIIRLIRGPGRWHRHWHDDSHGSSALDILKERFAKGEIDKQEYSEKKKALEE